MNRNRLWLGLSFVLVGLIGWSSVNGSQPAAQPASADTEKAVRSVLDAFQKAANARDAKAVTALWTEMGEFTDIDGTIFNGHAELEKMYTEAFKTSPKGKASFEIESIRGLGKNLATTEGTIKFVPEDGGPTEITKYSSLMVHEGDRWLIASAREWVPDPVHLSKLTDLEWLIGDWRAKRDDREVETSYKWGDEKAYILCQFKATEKGQVLTSGTEIIAKDPRSGQIRAWLFERSGMISEALWTRDGDRWIVELSGTLPDGSDLTAINTLVPNGNDAFSWVSVDRSVAGEQVPNTAPIKVTRVKK